MMASSAAASVDVTRSLDPDFSQEACLAWGSKAAEMMAPFGWRWWWWWWRKGGREVSQG